MTIQHKRKSPKKHKTSPANLVCAGRMMFQSTLLFILVAPLASIAAPDHVRVALTFMVLTTAGVILSRKYPPKVEHWLKALSEWCWDFGCGDEGPPSKR